MLDTLLCQLYFTPSMLNRVSEVRLKLGITQTELATRAKVSRQTIHAVETSKYVPSVELALKISRILKLPVEKLFFLKGD